MIYYEFRNDLGGGTWGKEKTLDRQIQVVSSPVRVVGEKSIKFDLRLSDPLFNGKHRAEIRLPKQPLKIEQWYGFSAYFPSTSPNWWQSESVEKFFFQVHASPDTNERWRWPIVGFFINKGNLRILNAWDTRSITEAYLPGNLVWHDFDGVNHPKIPIARDTWMDFVVHGKWYWDDRGLLEIWFNGDKIIERRDTPVCFNDNVRPGAYLKTGIYGRSDALDLVNYISHITQADGGGRYNDVSLTPQTEQPAPEPEPTPEPTPEARYELVTEPLYRKVS